MIFGRKHFKLEEAGGSFMGGASAPAGGEGGTPPEGGAGAPPATGDLQYKYPEGLDPSYHGNPTLLKYADKEGNFNTAAIAKALIHASTTIGADKIAVPTKNFTEEQWTETFRKLGVPEKLEDYKVDVKPPEGMELNKEMVEGLKQKAHQLGVLPKQLQGIIEYYNESSANQIKAQEGQWKQQLEQDRVALQKEWGDAFGANLKVAEQALKHFYPDEQERQAIVETGFLDTAAGTKFFAKLGKGLQEDLFDSETKASFGASPQELDSEISRVHGELYSMGRQHPQYQSKLQHYQSLLAKKHGDAKVSAGAGMRV